MDLVSLNNQIGSLDSKSFKELLPKQQTNRSYQDTEKNQKLIVSLNKFQYIQKNKKLLMIMQIMWNPMDPQRKTVTIDQLNQLANDWLMSNSNIGLKDHKTVKINSVNKNYITYEWDIDSWLNMNFNHMKPSFHAPSSFNFKFKNSIPTFVQSRFHDVELDRFIGERFKEWISKNNRIKLIKNNNFNFVSKLVPELFQYTVDHQKMEIIVSLKQSIVLAGFASALLYKNSEKFTKKELDNIKKEINKISSIKGR